MKRQLRMVRPNLDDLPPMQLSPGYEIRPYEEGDDAYWAAIITASFGHRNLTAADARRAIMDQDVFDPEGVFFATYEGTPVGTASAWRANIDEVECGKVHMVGVDTAHAGHKLGKWVSLAVLRYFREHEFICAKLDTDDFRIPALKTYLNLGFLPVYVDSDQAERWRKIFGIFGLEPIPDQAAVVRAQLTDRQWAYVGM